MRAIWLLLTCMVSPRPKYGTRQILKIFGVPMIITQKSVFLAVNANLRWLNNVSAVHFVQVSFP
jgi:hypothetical protein